MMNIYSKKLLLCSGTSSFPEIAGNAPLCFDPANPHDIATAINDLFKTPARIEPLIQKRQKRLQLFSKQKMAGETVNLYKKIL
jgi:glycosyltransferase involved in cell wall biosynthesis